MSKFGSINMKDMKKLQKELNKLQNREDLLEACTRELASRLLSMVVKRTPVGDYSKEIQVIAKRTSKYHQKGDVYTKRIKSKEKTGGTLRRGWISKTQEDAKNGNPNIQAKEIVEYVNGLQVSRSGRTYKIEIINPVEYALT